MIYKNVTKEQLLYNDTADETSVFTGERCLRRKRLFFAPERGCRFSFISGAWDTGILIVV
jgi:hypothetical protein